MKKTPAEYGLRWDQRGLIPVIVQDSNTKEVLMLAYATPVSLEMTLSTRRAHFWSRSRNKLWQKGETSGNFLEVQSIRMDCDADALLFEVTPAGPTCHTGHTSCFFSPFNIEIDTH